MKHDWWCLDGTESHPKSEAINMRFCASWSHILCFDFQWSLLLIVWDFGYDSWGYEKCKDSCPFGSTSSNSRIYIRVSTHKRHPISPPPGRAMGCLLWGPCYNSTGWAAQHFIKTPKSEWPEAAATGHKESATSSIVTQDKCCKHGKYCSTEWRQNLNKMTKFTISGTIAQAMWSLLVCLSRT